MLAKHFLSTSGAFFRELEMVWRPDDAHVAKDSRRKSRRRRRSGHVSKGRLGSSLRHSLSYKQIEAVDESAELKAFLLVKRPS